MQYLNLCRVFCWRNNTGGMTKQSPGRKPRTIRFGLVGSADVLGILPDGKFIGVECKAPGRGDDSTEAQRWFGQRVKEAGGVYIVATSTDDVHQVLSQLGYRVPR